MDAFQTFLEQYPAYADIAAIDALRTKDYARLDRGGHVYLDYTGGASTPIRKFNSIINCCTTMFLGTRTHPTPHHWRPPSW